MSVENTSYSASREQALLYLSGKQATESYALNRIVDYPPADPLRIYEF